jgi:hypothetical protein
MTSFDANFMLRNTFAHGFVMFAAMQQEGANARGTGLIAQDW